MYRSAHWRIDKGMKTLEEIARKYPKTDKFRNDRSGHCYGAFYEEALKPYRKLPISLLEIGVKSGDSLRIWRSYFRKAEITGMDCCLKKKVRVNGARVIEQDAYDRRIAKLLGPFDIIIDDGPHELGSWKKLVKLYLPKVKPGGLLVIEDFWANPSKLGLPDGVSHEVVDLRAVNGRRDDRLLVVRP